MVNVSKASPKEPDTVVVEDIPFEDTSEPEIASANRVGKRGYSANGTPRRYPLPTLVHGRPVFAVKEEN